MYISKFNKLSTIVAAFDILVWSVSLSVFNLLPLYPTALSLMKIVHQIHAK